MVLSISSDQGPLPTVIVKTSEAMVPHKKNTIVQIPHRKGAEMSQNSRFCWDFQLNCRFRGWFKRDLFSFWSVLRSGIVWPHQNHYKWNCQSEGSNGCNYLLPNIFIYIWIIDIFGSRLFGNIRASILICLVQLPDWGLYECYMRREEFNTADGRQGRCCYNSYPVGPRKTMLELFP